MTRFQRWFLYGSTAVTTVSGVTYFVTNYFMTPVDPWAVINHPLEPWALKAHILSATLMLFAVGLISTQHIWRSLRSRLPTGRKSGLLALAAFAPLAISGYLIQPLTAPPILLVLAWSHLGLGLVCAAALLSHRVVLKSRRRLRRGALPVLPLETTDTQTSVTESPPFSRATAGARASRCSSERRERHSGSCRPKRGRRAASL